MLILVHQTVVSEKRSVLEGLCAEIEHCSALIYPAEGPRAVLCLTGVHISPSNTAHLTLGRLAGLGAPMRSEEGPEDLPRIIAGDFNIATWSPLYAEWIQEHGLQELLGPATRTFALGSSIDNFLFLPGAYVPSTFLPPGDSRLQWRDGAMDAPY